MSNTIALKRRIGSVKNTRQITKAMELVAASKMRRAIEYALPGRVYREHAHSLLARLTTVTDVLEHPLYKQRPIKSRLYVIITSDRGLAGAYNSNVIKMLTRSVIDDVKDDVKSKVIVIGSRGAQFVRRLAGIELAGVYTNLGDRPSTNDIRPVLNTIVQQFSTAEVDDIELIYTQHKSNILQIAAKTSLLPARLDESMQGQALTTTTFEPSIEVVLESVTVRLLEVQIWQALLESIASEQSMRMLAMKNATDNASDIIEDLTLAFNTARQAAITQEIAEITGGAEAMK